MLQAVPLRAALGIHVDLIVESVDAHGLGAIHHLVLKRFAAEAGEFQVIQRPVQLHVAARLDLQACRANHRWSQQIDCCGFLVSTRKTLFPLFLVEQSE